MIRLTATTVNVAIVFAGIAIAQPREESVQFDAASVKPASPPPRMAMAMTRSGGPGTANPGAITYANAPLRTLLEDAYALQKHQLIGPSWLAEARFDVIGKVPPGATKDQARIMLQRLLVERFSLTFHRETREFAVYALVAAKGGPKMKAAAPGPAGPAPEGFPNLPPGQESGIAGAMGPNLVLRLNARRQTLRDLVAFLNRSAFDRPVVDASGLSVTYDFTLEYLPEGVRRADGTPLAPPVDDGVPAAATIFSALQSQLGLRLDSRKAPYEVVVVDHIEKVPTEN